MESKQVEETRISSIQGVWPQMGVASISFSKSFFNIFLLLPFPLSFNCEVNNILHVSLGQ